MTHIEALWGDYYFVVNLVFRTFGYNIYQINFTTGLKDHVSKN